MHCRLRQKFVMKMMRLSVLEMYCEQEEKITPIILLHLKSPILIGYHGHSSSSNNI